MESYWKKSLCINHKVSNHKVKNTKLFTFENMVWSRIGFKSFYEWMNPYTIMDILGILVTISFTSPFVIVYLNFILYVDDLLFTSDKHELMFLEETLTYYFEMFHLGIMTLYIRMQFIYLLEGYSYFMMLPCHKHFTLLQCVKLPFLNYTYE